MTLTGRSDPVAATRRWVFGASTLAASLTVTFIAMAIWSPAISWTDVAAYARVFDAGQVAQLVPVLVLCPVVVVLMTSLLDSPVVSDLRPEQGDGGSRRDRRRAYDDAQRLRDRAALVPGRGLTPRDPSPARGLAYHTQPDSLTRGIKMKRRKFLAASTATMAAAAWRPSWLLGSAATNPSSATVLVDPRMELFNVILYLGGFRGFAGNSPLTRLGSPYLDRVEAEFGRFRGHAVVARYEGMAERGFWLTHPPSAMLHLSHPPGLAERIPINAFTVRMAGGREALDAFLAEARDFAEESAFMRWFHEQTPVHARMVEAYTRQIEWDYVQDLVDYYGDQRESYTVVLAPLSHGGGFGPRLVRPDGSYDAYAIIGPRSVEQGKLRFASGRSMRTLFWHEFSHSHVNHLTDRHLDRFMGPADVLQGHLREQVEEYVPWEVHVNDWISEHIVRGVTTRLAHLKVGPEEAASALEREVQQFPFVAEVAQLLVEYEADRSQYSSLDRFYPRLIELFEGIAKAESRAGA